MKERDKLAKMINKATLNDGILKTSIPGVSCLKFSEPSVKLKGNWEKSLVIVVQGQKEIALVSNTRKYNEVHYIATPIGMPVVSRVRIASKEEPYLALLLALDHEVLSEIGELMSMESRQTSSCESRGIFSGETSAEMLGAAIRLLELTEKLDDAKVLGPLIVKEIYYHLLKSSNGSSIFAYTVSGNKYFNISRAIMFIKLDLVKEINVENLARQVSMSRSSFFRSFKEVTSMSPIQYQKRLRLVEARRLLTKKNESAQNAAFKVGYKSSSQFSREYSRMFGRPPVKDIS